MGGKHGKVGKLFDPSKLKKMFDEYDGDNTGSIQLDELKRVVNDVFLGFSMDKKRKEEALWEYFPSVIVGYTTSFGDWPTASDSVIDKNKVLEYVAQNLLLLLDTNGDGQVTYEEWRSFNWEDLLRSLKEESDKRTKQMRSLLCGKWVFSGDLTEAKTGAKKAIKGVMFVKHSEEQPYELFFEGPDCWSTDETGKKEELRVTKESYVACLQLKLIFSGPTKVLECKFYEINFEDLQSGFFRVEGGCFVGFNKFGTCFFEFTKLD